MCQIRSLSSTDRENFTIKNGVELNSSSKETPSQNAIPSISLPPAVFQRINNVTSTGLVFTLYDQSTLFPVGNTSEASKNTNVTMTVVGSQVIAASVAQDGPKVENLDDPVLVLLPVRISGEVSSNKSSLGIETGCTLTVDSLFL